MSGPCGAKTTSEHGYETALRNYVNVDVFKSLHVAAGIQAQLNKGNCLAL